MSSHRNVCVGSRVSDRQKELLLAFVKEHPQIATLSCPLEPSFTREDRDDMWQELVALLNEVPARNTTALPNSESSRAAPEAARLRVTAAASCLTGTARVDSTRGPKFG
ncbi:uncharacterized protein LOC125758915 [Rhipicephalus sanguineus]|uniref:uncharacterized protein LOC125758915 n=1 Tax=Rhipicephalus sanguineus TaxID=34632 RepID=UPI0020C293E9|nr:uncharacterized protein LOC125758915 [Rhipicephalus sanguineus]